LQHLDDARQAHGTLGRDAQPRVGGNILRHGIARDVYELALIAGIDFRGVDLDNKALAFFQRPRRLHRPALRPEQEDAGTDHQDQSEECGFEDVHDARPVAKGVVLTEHIHSSQARQSSAPDDACAIQALRSPAGRG